MSKQPKIKTYVLRVSRNFPKGHPSAGQFTHFKDMILLAIGMENDMPFEWNKLHTMRGNVAYWLKAAEEINAGRAILSLRQWEGGAIPEQVPGICPANQDRRATCCISYSFERCKRFTG